MTSPAEAVAAERARQAAEDADRRARRAYAAGQLTIAELVTRLRLVASGDTAAIDRATDGLDAVPPRNPARGGHHRWRPADLDVLTELAAIADPRERLKRAAEITETAYANEQVLRQSQVLAAVAAHVRYGAPQVVCYTAITMGREKFQRKVKQAPAALPVFGTPELREQATALAATLAAARTVAAQAAARTDLAAINAELVAAAIEEAARPQADYERQHAKAATARMVRDREFRALVGGVYGERVKAIRLAEDTGVTKALVSLILKTPAAAA